MARVAPNLTLEALTARIAHEGDAMPVLRELFEAFRARQDPSLTLNRRAIDRLTPDVLGVLFEKQLHQKSHSAYYTPHRIAQYVARTVVHDLVLRRLNHPGPIETAFEAIAPEQLLSTLQSLRILDPACGTGDLLLAAFDVLHALYARVPNHALDPAHEIVTRNLFGADLMPDAIEVAQMRFRLAAPTATPNLRSGNALIGLTEPASDPNTALLQQFHALGIAYEHVSWDDAKQVEGPATKRPLTIEDIEKLRPLHWPDRFDAVIANPPWDIFKPNAREFFERYSDLVTKRKMSMEAFDTTRAELLQDDEIRTAWLEYVSSYRHVSAWFRSAPQYRHQVSRVNGRRAGTDTNLYKLFAEQSFNLLRPGGIAGLILPSGIYTDLGAKQLRQMLFDETTVTGLIGFENRRALFEDVHRSFKFIVLNFRKEPRTESFPAVFMQHSLDALDRFPTNAVEVRTDLVRQLSLDSLSLMEFRSPFDVRIAEKMVRHPLLNGRLKPSSEFHMTSERKLFRTEPAPGRLPLFEGKMIWQFDSHFAPSRYWVDEAEGRRSVLGKTADAGQPLDYQQHRLAIRAIAANTNERTLIATVLPRNVFCGNSLLVATLPLREALYYIALLNSFVVDAFLRSKVTTNINIFYLQQLPIPLFESSPTCERLINAAATLVCQSKEFAFIADELGIEPQQRTGSEVRQLRAEIDADVAHMYGLEWHELVHVLDSFPLVPQTIREQTRRAFEQRLTSR